MEIIKKNKKLIIITLIAITIIMLLFITIYDNPSNLTPINADNGVTYELKEKNNDKQLLLKDLTSTVELSINKEQYELIKNNPKKTLYVHYRKSFLDKSKGKVLNITENYNK